MYKITVKIDGMMCGMCESHINDAIRNKMPVKKVSSSHKKGETVIISENELTSETVTAALDASARDSTRDKAAIKIRTRRFISMRSLQKQG